MSRSYIWWNVMLLGVLMGGTVFIVATRVSTTTGIGTTTLQPTKPAAASSALPAPAFALPTVDGTMVALQDAKGQVVLINIWATWCPPCQAEMPVIEAAFEQYREQGFTVLAVNQGEPASAVQSFVHDYGLTFPTLLDSAGVVSRAYAAHTLPSSYLVDRQGTLRMVYRGPISRTVLAGMVEQLLAEER